LICKTQNLKYPPHKPTKKQRAFLALARTGQYREIFYGGAGGGGKSDALLMLALQDDWLQDSDYSALILRKTFVDLNQPEGILNRAQEWLFGREGVTWQAQHNRFQFDTGAVLQFGHCNGPKDHLKYRGGKYNVVLWDELTDFPEEQYTFLFSRQRRPLGSTLPLLTAAASNPGGTGHAWVRSRFVKSQTTGRMFIPASYLDNPHLDQKAYGETLDNLLPTERARIKHGDWDVLDGSALFDRRWFKVVNQLPEGPRLSVRSWDTAATPGGGDYSVGLRMHKIEDEYFIDSIVRGQYGPSDLDRIQRETAESDGEDVIILLEREPGSAGKRVNQFMRQQLEGYIVFEESASGDKYFRATPSARAASNDKIRLVKGSHITAFMDEVPAFTGKVGVDAHDDIVDAMSLGFNYLSRRVGMSLV
jgi:phage terminase large subunit-like protein